LIETGDPQPNLERIGERQPDPGHANGMETGIDANDPIRRVIPAVALIFPFPSIRAILSLCN
jgi:hypothetical protein